MPHPTPANASANLSSRRIAIIGGGISGLAAAHRVAEIIPKADVELFEASHSLGGVLQTTEDGGFLVEHSADNFLVNPAAAIELCRRIGIADELLTTDESRRRAFIVRSGRLIPIPEGFYLMSPRKLWPVLASPALSVAGKLRLLAEPLVPRRFCSPGDFQNQRSLNLPDESVASFVRRRLGREVFERIVQPLVAGIYTADPEQLSMAATMPQFVEYERRFGSMLRATLFNNRNSVRAKESLIETAHSAHSISGARYGLFVAPRRGMASLVSALAERLGRCAIHLNAPVKRITRLADHWQVETLRDSAVPTRDFDAVVLALPAPIAANVLSAGFVALSRALSQIEYAGCAVVSLKFAREQITHPLNGFGFVVPQTEKRQIIAGSFASLKFAGRAPAEQVLIRVFLGGALQPELLNLSNGELARIAVEELSALLSIRGEPSMTNVARWLQSMPQYHVGHLERVDRIERLAEQLPAFALAGNAYRGVGIPQCIASGEAAAERLASVFEPHLQSRI
jgi:oxygen-dependent protoporphyrinogen oxidase